jgi:hypothetical protein
MKGYGLGDVTSDEEEPKSNETRQSSRIDGNIVNIKKPTSTDLTVNNSLLKHPNDIQKYTGANSYYRSSSNSSNPAMPKRSQARSNLQQYNQHNHYQHQQHLSSNHFCFCFVDFRNIFSFLFSFAFLSYGKKYTKKLSAVSK